ncbi:MAG: hypothetical protein FWH38_00800 [Treponema sp.]|nr:hypothetical protein [Treponema sp.]
MKDNILPKLSKYLFWDYNIDKLDPNFDIKLILERVFTLGTENDEKAVFNYYGKSRIKDTILNINNLDKKTINYLSIVFNIPKEEFKCYRKSLSKEPFGIF